jgi:hypothetical protein
LKSLVIPVSLLFYAYSMSVATAEQGLWRGVMQGHQYFSVFPRAHPTPIPREPHKISDYSEWSPMSGRAEPDSSPTRNFPLRNLNTPPTHMTKANMSDSLSQNDFRTTRSPTVVGSSTASPSQNSNYRDAGSRPELDDLNNVISSPTKPLAQSSMMPTPTPNAGTSQAGPSIQDSETNQAKLTYPLVTHFDKSRTPFFTDTNSSATVLPRASTTGVQVTRVFSNSSECKKQPRTSALIEISGSARPSPSTITVTPNSRQLEEYSSFVTKHSIKKFSSHTDPQLTSREVIANSIMTTVAGLLTTGKTDTNGAKSVQDPPSYPLRASKNGTGGSNRGNTSTTRKNSKIWIPVSVSLGIVALVTGAFAVAFRIYHRSGATDSDTGLGDIRSEEGSIWSPGSRQQILFLDDPARNGQVLQK